MLRYLVKTWAWEDAKNRWYRHWVETGLEAVERQLADAPATGRFCHGDTPGFADCVLVPQIHNAQRMDCRLEHVPTVMRVFEGCMAERLSRDPGLACPDAAGAARRAGWYRRGRASRCRRADVDPRGRKQRRPVRYMNLGVGRR